MVAYSFQRQFVEPIRALTKRQTIRALGRRRHAQPGQLVQLYCGMRTRGCFKIAPDVVCVQTLPVRFDLRDGGRSALHDGEPEISIGGIWLIDAARDAFARSDGFADFGEMVGFWLKEHGDILFEGVCIRWREMVA